VGGKSCYFIGHRDAREKIYPFLKKHVLNCIVHFGVTEFFVGHYGSFDRLAAKAVIEVKRTYPDIRLRMVLPYHPAVRPVKLSEGFDGSYYPWSDEHIPHRLAIVKTNQYMVKTCDFLVAYAWRPASRARDLVEYAEKQGATVINIANETDSVL